MKVAIISDIHGNLEALKTVLADIHKRQIDKIFCLGDIIAKGTHQEECTQLVKKECCLSIAGNCDVAFSRDIDINLLPEIERKRYIWNRSKLSQDSIDYLKSLPFCEEFYISGRLVRLYHATPTVINDLVGNIDDLNRYYSLFLPSKSTKSQEKCDVVIFGHVHVQFVQHIYNRTIINVGSVGNSIDVFRNVEKDGPCQNTVAAQYMILDGEFGSKDYNNSFSYEMISLPYDIEKELSENTDNIEMDSYQDELRYGKYRDMPKIYRSFKYRGIIKGDI